MWVDNQKYSTHPFMGIRKRCCSCARYTKMRDQKKVKIPLVADTEPCTQLPMGGQLSSYSIIVRDAPPLLPILPPPRKAPSLSRRKYDMYKDLWLSPSPSSCESKNMWQTQNKQKIVDWGCSPHSQVWFNVFRITNKVEQTARKKTNTKNSWGRGERHTQTDQKHSCIHANHS